MLNVLLHLSWTDQLHIPNSEVYMLKIHLHPSLQRVARFHRAITIINFDGYEHQIKIWDI
jgi:hypothetical protein